MELKKCAAKRVEVCYPSIIVHTVDSAGENATRAVSLVRIESASGEEPGAECAAFTVVAVPVGEERSTSAATAETANAHNHTKE